MIPSPVGLGEPDAWFSGADLANLLNEAAILTARQNMLRIGQFRWRAERITMGLSNRLLQDSAKKRPCLPRGGPCPGGQPSACQ